VSDEPLSIGRRFSEALADQDLDAVLSVSDPEIELWTPRGILRGHDGVRRLLAGPPLEHLEREVQIDDVVRAGERIVALARMRYTWRESGELADVHHVAAVLDVHNGVVTRWQPFLDRDAALAAAEEPPGGGPRPGAPDAALYRTSTRRLPRPGRLR
jgi:limonene-1,2-epoxide hydrolase